MQLLLFSGDLNGTGGAPPFLTARCTTGVIVNLRRERERERERERVRQIYSQECPECNCIAQYSLNTHNAAQRDHVFQIDATQYNGI